MSIAPELALGSSRDHRDHVKKGRKFLNPNNTIKNFEADAQKLNSILDKIKAPKKNRLLSIDVEGAEFSVLGGIDFKKYHFEFMLIETKEFQKMKDYLSKFHYSYVKHLSEHDVLFSYNQRF